MLKKNGTKVTMGWSCTTSSGGILNKVSLPSVASLSIAYEKKIMKGAAAKKPLRVPKIKKENIMVLTENKAPKALNLPSSIMFSQNPTIICCPIYQPAANNKFC